MEHQNWETFIVHAKNPVKSNKLNEKKKNPQYVKSKDKKLEESIENGDMKHKLIDPELSKKIQQARLSKNLTQKQLAQQLSIPQQTINEIETGKFKYNGQIITKVKRKLNIK